MKTLHDIKIEHVRDTLVECRGNKTQAAARLDIGIRTLRNIISSDARLADFRITRRQYLARSRALQNLGRTQ